MGVYEGRGQLAKSMKDLLLRWSETKMAWDDAMARGIEKDVLEPLQADLRTAASAMDHMAALLSQIQRECE